MASASLSLALVVWRVAVLPCWAKAELIHHQSILLRPRQCQWVSVLLRTAVELSSLPAGNGGDAGYCPRVLDGYVTRVYRHIR